MKYDLVVIGLGYIGLPTASIFATRGQKVLGVDIKQEVVDTINQGNIHIVEPELDVLVRSAVQSGFLRADISPASADVFIIAVPTPFRIGSNSERHPDLAYVESAARRIAPVVGHGDLVILESTSPVGTTERVRNWITDERSLRSLPPVSALYAHCPERILPGQMLKELVTNDRICGGLSVEAAQKAREFYRCICTGKILITDAATAEMVKLTENACRDVNIAFANELSMICDKLKLDPWEVIRLANHHPRVKILQPGPGVGGHCIAVDPWFIVDSAPEESRLIRAAREVNDAKPCFILNKIREAAQIKNSRKIACLGLSFKADVDDLRESPSVEICHVLATEGYELHVVEPHIRSLPKSLQLPGVILTDATAAIETCAVVVLLVNHRQFTAIPRPQDKERFVIDTRGAWRSVA